MGKQMCAYEEIAGESFPKPQNATGVTFQMDYQFAKPYLSDKPLRRPDRTILNPVAPTYEQLRELAARHKPPQEWHDELMGNE